MQPLDLFVVIKCKKIIIISTTIDIHKDLVEQCKQNNAKAQYEIYNLYSKAMFNICIRLMGSIEDAEDRLQEAFIYAFKRLDSFRYESTFGAWLKTIVINNCINALKKRKEDLVFFDSMNNFDDEDDSLDAEDVKFNVNQIHEAMNELPEGGRVIFSLYLLEGYDHREIAQIMNITESTSKSQYSRAKQKICNILKSKSL